LDELTMGTVVVTITHKSDAGSPSGHTIIDRSKIRDDT
jgi:hypothetical protein